MRVIPVGGPPPQLYQASDVLKKPRGPQQFTDVVQRLRRFHRNSVLVIGSRMLWHMWNHPDTLKESDSGWKGNRITQMYAERIISLACIYCSAHNRPPMREVDFRLLCWELYSCEDENPFGPDAAALLKARLQDLKPTSPLRALDPQLVPYLLGVALKARVISEQSIGRYWDRGRLVRSYLIARELRALGLKSTEQQTEAHLARTYRQSEKGETNNDELIDYETVERRFFLTSMAEAYRALWVLYVKANDGVRRELQGPTGPIWEHDPGRILLNETAAEEEVLGTLGLAGGGLRAAASRLSIRLSECSALRAELEAVEPKWQRYAPQVDWLTRWPIIDLELGGPCEHLIAPSPWRLMLAFNERVLFSFVKFLEQEGGLHEPPPSVRGAAFASYLSKVLKGVPNFYDVDALVRSGETGKRPDFLWVGEQFGVLVEAKFSLRPNSDRGLKDVSAALAAWDRAAEPLDQAREFLSVHLPRLEARLRAPRRWVLAVVTSESLVEESLGFRGIVKAGNLLAGTGLQSLMMVTPGELEEWALNSDADAFARRAIEVYTEFDPSLLKPVPLLGRPTLGKLRSPPHIADAWAELFGKPLEVEEA
jgi:hypothetical protein